MHRLSATKMILENAGDLPIVGNLGPTSDELWHLAADRDRNFYGYGSMGLCSSMALGMALSTDEKVISLDGDGSLLMNMGTLATIGREQPRNLIVIVWDNEMWGQTGMQPTHTAFGTSLEQVGKGCNIPNTATVDDEESLATVFRQAFERRRPLAHSRKDRRGRIPAHCPRRARNDPLQLPQDLRVAYARIHIP